LSEALTGICPLNPLWVPQLVLAGPNDSTSERIFRYLVPSSISVTDSRWHIQLTNSVTRTLQSKPVRRVDFDLKSYMASDDRIALWQIINTIVPLIFAAIGLSVVTSSFDLQSILLAPVLFLLIILLMSRSFSLMHDCGHQSLFASRLLNRCVAFGLSLIHGIPHHPWSRGHAFHHKYNGNWDRYRGPSALTTREQYANKTSSGRFIYQVLRHPLLLFPGGFYYLILKPRIALVLGFLELLYSIAKISLFDLRQKKWPNLIAMVRGHKSSFFYTSGEVYDTIFNTALLIACWWFIGSAIGHLHFWILYIGVMSSSAALMIAVFFVQHNFPGSYASDEQSWSYFKGAIEGSSFLQLPPVLNWFTADIAYHHIHHLSERIPNYRLRDCHFANLHLLGDVKPLYMHQIPSCFSLILWDNADLELVSVGL